jgi:hypothetical protein
MSPVRHELRVYVSEDDILHSHRRVNLKSYTDQYLLTAQATGAGGCILPEAVGVGGKSAFLSHPSSSCG